LAQTPAAAPNLPHFSCFYRGEIEADGTSAQSDPRIFTVCYGVLSND